MGISPVLNGLIKKHVELQTSLRDLEGAAEKAVKDIRRANRRKFNAEEKIRIVIEALLGESSIADAVPSGRHRPKPLI